MAPVLTDLPAIFVSANYRLAPEAKHPEPFDDCVDALAWLYRNIADYGGSRDRLFVGGHSAGGHLAALVGLKREAWAARGLPRDVVKACFPLSGPVNLRLDEMDPEGRRIKVTRLLLAGTKTIVMRARSTMLPVTELHFLLPMARTTCPKWC